MHTLRLWKKLNIIQRQHNSASCQIKCFNGIQHLWPQMTSSYQPMVMRLHGVVVVGHEARRFTTGGVLKTRVIGITEDSLDPWQDPWGGHGLVGEVAWGRGDRVGFQVIYEYLCIIFLSLFLTKELFSHIHVDGTVDSLFSATLVPWTA